MPILEIITNLAKSKIPADFLKKATKKAAQLTSKPESYVQISVLADQLVSFAGNDAPAAHVRFLSIGTISASMVSELTIFITSELGIPKDRFYIILCEGDPKTIAYNGATFA